MVVFLLWRGFHCEIPEKETRVFVSPFWGKEEDERLSWKPINRELIMFFFYFYLNFN
jgi:hypothetical protein